MESCNRDRQMQRDVRRRVCCRLACHWLLFFGVALLLTAVLEFLFGEPRKPSFAILGEAFHKHAILFAALLVLIPISLRDCVKCIDRAVFSQTRTESPQWPATAAQYHVGEQPSSPGTDRRDAGTRTVTETRQEPRQPAPASV
jgi:hypothetical protein